MKVKIINYILPGIISAILSWLPLNYQVTKDTPYIHGLIVIFLPSIILAIFLYIVLDYKKSELTGKPFLNMITLISFCSVGWFAAIIVSTVGVDFNFYSPFQSPSELFVAGLLPAITGMLFTGTGIYLCLKKPLLFSKYRILSIFVVASSVGILLFSALSQYLVKPVGSVISVITSVPASSTREIASILILFLIWHTTLFIALPFVTRRKSVSI